MDMSKPSILFRSALFALATFVAVIAYIGEESLWARIFSTLLPLAILGGTVLELYLYKRQQRILKEIREEPLEDLI